MTRHESQLLTLFRIGPAIVGLLLLAVGCASMAPRYQQPALPVADHYPADAPEANGDSVGDNLAWHDVFVDPDLQRVIEQALQNNRDLRVSVLRVEEARALRGIVRADRFPNMSMNAQGNRSRTPADLSLTGQATVSSAYQVTAGATWELDFWGRVRSLDAAALESYFATEAAHRAFAVSLVAQVADAWLLEREYDQRIELARRSIATREESFRIFRRRYEEGSSGQLELTQVETLLTQAQALGAQLEQARAANRHALSLLVGTPLDVGVQTGTFDTQDPVRTLRTGLPSQLLASRPDVIAAEHSLKAAHANIGAARAAFFPQVVLTGDYGTASAEFSGLFDSGSHAWSFLPSISVPIFAGGRLRSNLTLAQVRRDIAVASYESTIQAAFRDVADALSAQQWLNEQTRIQRHALSVQTERSRLAQLRYSSGAATYLEVLDAQRELLSAEQTLVQTQRALQSSRVGLFAAIGGGTLGAARD